MAKKKVHTRSESSKKRSSHAPEKPIPSESTETELQSQSAENLSVSNETSNVEDSIVKMIPIAAVGASAGGLEPIETFFDVMPVDSGCAFVIIQHLSPDFRSLMDELLARHSSMKIHRVTDGMEIEPDSIYLNPPRSVMTIKGNRLRIEKIDTQDLVYLPIDLFFNSLAASRRESAIGIVLSGTGSDGTKGSESISNAGGSVLVQDPHTTRFDGMPKSVIADGHYTVIAPPPDLALSVVRLLNNESLEGMGGHERMPIEEPLQDLLSMLKHRYGTDFEQYKEATVKRRIERRAQMKRITDINDYRDILNTDELELQELYADLLIEVTEFFRDPQAFEILEKQVIPELMQDLKDGDALRIWVPGCASGEEAYSIAILLQERAREKGLSLHLKILATDIHIRSMNQASSGIYPEEALSRMPVELVNRYFDSADGQAQIKPSIRNMVFFSTHDLMRDPPFTRIDLVSCRNLLIYLKEDSQEKVLNLLHFSLRKDGFLFLGPSEHIGAIAHEFDVVNEKWRIFKKRRDIKLLPAESIFQRADISKDVASVNTHARLTPNSRQALVRSEDSIPFKRAQRAALESIVSRYAPPGFLLTEDGVIVHIFGDAGALLPMRSGSFSKRIVDLIMPELKVIVSAALDHARSVGFTGFSRAAYVKDESGEAAPYEVLLENLELPGEALRFLLLSIKKQTPVHHKEASEEPKVTAFATSESNDALNQRILVLEHSLQSSEESLQSTIEELETSNEELQSTNEELMSTNEELQSTNEELHSVNEELYTVSAEHQRKNEELTERDTDLDMLLQLSKIGTIHLDNDLRLRRFTHKARSVFNIMPQDVGRPFNHITALVDDHDIAGMVRQVSRDKKTQETQLEINGEVYLLRVLSYERDDKIPRGVLLTIIDISDLQTIKAQLQSLDLVYKDIVENSDSFIVRWDAKTERILFCNEQFAQRWNSSVEELLGQNIVELRPEREQAGFRDSLLQLSPGASHVKTQTATGPDGLKRAAHVSTRAISLDGTNINEYQLNGSDCTEEEKFREAIQKLSFDFSDTSLDPQAKLENILKVGLDYFGLDTAIISMIVGNKYTVLTVVSHVEVPYESGTVLDLGDTLCGQFVDKSSSLLIDNVSKSEFAGLPCHRSTGIECFVGASVQTATGPFGSVSFSSANPRLFEFSLNEDNFALMIAGWIGYLQGNLEQLEFMEGQNNYYKTLFATVPAMMFLTDEDGLIISVSNRFAETLDLDAETVPGMNCLEFFQAESRSAIKEALQKGVARRLPALMGTHSKDNFEVELNMSVKSVGSLLGVRMIIVTDVSERNLASREAADQNRRLEAANENLNQFAFIASHDLQEPLRKIQQFSSFLEEDLTDVLTDDASYHLNVIVDASQRMSALIHDLLQYSGTSKVDPEMESVNLNTLLGDIVGELEISIEESQAKLSIDQLPEVHGNKPLLRQLFTNLVSNSIKYRAADRPLKLSIKMIKNGHQEGIIVADNGIGFEMEFARKIFEPFNRLHNSKEYQGNGIGLAICNTVCEKHDWRLSAESEPDVGSTFTILF